MAYIILKVCSKHVASKRVSTSSRLQHTQVNHTNQQLRLKSL